MFLLNKGIKSPAVKAVDGAGGAIAMQLKTHVLIASPSGQYEAPVKERTKPIKWQQCPKAQRSLSFNFTPGRFLPTCNPCKPLQASRTVHFHKTRIQAPCKAWRQMLKSSHRFMSLRGLRRLPAPCRRRRGVLCRASPNLPWHRVAAGVFCSLSHLWPHAQQFPIFTPARKKGGS